ncbi:hypothetical protein PRIPAC_95186 [Pristionchus pacificus]|uniref:G protein-coupled receptor n=1 Tax=Pristionchus pacificus TaxID=54126 RepID=A0A2A6D2U9_PRIPA|nr:hypothetical protein PRIPAC_95186 [Pristionchus pacificus]|eukprot:PDM84637.1 G protein-coupled receptor [Pristionchus pacificus]
MIETLDASSKALLDTVKLWTTTISIVLSVLAVYVLVRFLNQSTTLYRNLLVAITTMSVLSDVWLQIFLDPVFMFPLPCMHIQGALRKWTIISPVFGFFAVEHSDEVSDSYFTNLSESWPENIRNRTNCVIQSECAQSLLNTSYRSLFAAYSQSLQLYAGLRAYFLHPRVYERENACDSSTTDEITNSTGNFCFPDHTKSAPQRRRLDRHTHLHVAIPILTILLPESVLVVRYILDIESPEFAPIILKCLGVHSIAHSLTVIASSHGFTRSLCGKTDERKITVSRTPGFRT